MVDDASPDGTQEIAKQLAGIYGEDKVVSRHDLSMLWQLTVGCRY